MLIMKNMMCDINYCYAYFNKDDLAKECRDILDNYGCLYSKLPKLKDNSMQILLEGYKFNSIPSSNDKINLLAEIRNIDSYNTDLLIKDTSNDIDIFSYADFKKKDTKLDKNIYDFEYLERIARDCISNYSETIEDIYNAMLVLDNKMVINGQFIRNLEDSFMVKITSKKSPLHSIDVLEDVFFMRQSENPLPPIHIIRIKNMFL